ncbi:MAG: calcium/sodium antiporter [Firmicutes bacterium]|nr:calcium/sodium antiporter [Bacillota bacterium]
MPREMEWLWTAVGLGALWVGAELLVRGAARLAVSFGLSPLFIGLTVVGFGTSTPEMVTSAVASVLGQPAVALGNVLGSNIANIGLILALAALIFPLRAALGLLRFEVPLMLLVSAAVYALAWTGGVGVWAGAVLLAALAGFVALALAWAQSEPEAIAAEYAAFEQQRGLLTPGSRTAQIVFILAGLALLVAGRFGVSEAAIGATLVAVGTSLPELATTLVAAARRQADIAVGNIVGSNIFNLLGVLGLAAVLRPVPVPVAVRDFEFPWMLGFALAAVLVLRTGHRISRVEGAVLLAAYAVFLALILP